MAEEFNVSVTFSGKNNMSSAANTVNNDLNRVNRAVRDTDQSMGRLEQNINRIRQAMDLGIAGAMLGRVNAFAQEFYDLGQNVNTAEMTFRALAGSTQEADRLLGMMRTSTGNIINDFQLMEGASRFLSMGLADNNQEVARLTELAVRLGGAMGNDAAASIENFSLLLANESVLRLDSFGISSARVRERIDELLASGEALNRSDAFRMAVLEEGGASLERLGDAASAAETPLARLQTRLDNIFNRGAQNFAIGVTAITGSIEALVNQANRNESRIERAMALLRASGQSDPQNLNILGYEFNLARDVTEDQVVAALAAADAQAQLIQRIREGGMWIRDQARAWNDNRAQAEAAADAQQRISGLQANIMGPHSNLNQLFGRFGGTTGFDIFGDITADIQFFDPGWLGEVGDQLRNLTYSLDVARQLNEDGLLPDDTLANFERAAERAEAIARAAVEGAEAFENMRLSDALGEGGGDPLLSDVNAAILQELADRGILDEAALQQAADTFGLASGEITRGSLTFRDNVVPALARVTERLGATMGAQRAGQVEDFMRNAALMGLDPNSMAYNAGLSLSTGMAGIWDFQSAFQPLINNIDYIRQTAAPDMETQLASMPGPTQAINDATTLGKVLEEVTSKPYEVKVNVSVNDPHGILSGNGISVNVNGGGSGDGSGRPVTRDGVDMRGRSTSSTRLTPTR